MSTSDRNVIARFALIACDQAYQAVRPVDPAQRLIVGSRLTYFDDTPWYVDPGTFVQPRPPQAFQTVASGFTVASVIADDSTGFKAVIYRNSQGDIIAAFAGTDG